MGKAHYDCFTTERTTLERATFVGPWDEGGVVIDALHADGWRIVRQGPYSDRRMFPNVDVTRFLYVAEREVAAAGGDE